MESKFTPLPLEPRNPYALKYFIPHSGVVEAYSTLSRVANNLLDEYRLRGKSSFALFFLTGEHSAGKTHLARGIVDYLVERGFPAENAAAFELSTDYLGGKASTFIDQYEQMRSRQGMLVICSTDDVERYSSDPHIYSRLMSAWVLTLNYPKESEFQSVIRSLLERRNMLLSDHAIAYLLARLPLTPASFSSIIDQLDDLALSEGKAPGEKLLRQLVNNA